jgi:flagellin
MSVFENTTTARWQIADADFALETASLSRALNLQQASTAMQAHANAAPQRVLSLLR